MDAHLDWVSWTLPTKIEPIDQHDLKTTARIQMKGVSDDHSQFLFGELTFDRTTGRAPYRICVVREDYGLRVYGSSPTETVLYELSGRGCETLGTLENGREFIGPLCERITRLDLAVDIRTDVGPIEFANEAENGRFRSRSEIVSDTGTTVYVGSPKSGRFARVYRYNHPHPRAALLRVEFVFRGKLARAAATQLYQQKDARAMVAVMGNTWGWLHRCWQPDIQTDEKVFAPSSSRAEQDTARWLYVQVVPAMRRMLKTGALNMTDFLEEVYKQ